MASCVHTVNQDCACIAHPLSADPDAALFIVLDGHGKHGHRVSSEALHRIHEFLDDCAWEGDFATSEAQFVTAFEQAEERLKSFDCDDKGRPAAMSSGAVGVSVLLRWGVLWTAHVGDCRAVLGRAGLFGDMEAVALTEDHVRCVPDTLPL